MNPWHCARRTAGAFLGALFLAVGGFHCNDGAVSSSERPKLAWPGQSTGSTGAVELQPQVRLDGRYVGEVRLQRDKSGAAGPQQDLAIQFAALGLDQVKQFEFVLQPEPASAFDLAASRFVPEKPFATFGAGVELMDQGRLRIAGAYFSRQGTVQGDQVLGTLTLRTGPAFTPAAQPRLRVLFFSIGPNSTDRDSYAEQVLKLGLALE